MQFILFLIFIAVPIAEVAIFIQAGGLIGLVPTILITIGTAIAGSFLMRMQGFAALNRFGEAANRGEMPITPVVDGIGILSAGLLLLTPGLLTDAIGLLLFVPPIRRGLAQWVFRKTLKSGQVRYARFRQSTAAGPQSPPHQTAGNQNSYNHPDNDNVVDADFETVAPHQASDDVTPLDADDEAARGEGRKDTPWRKP